MTLIWQEPPARRRGRKPDPVLVEAADRLRENPEEWALVKTYNAPNTAHKVKARITRGEGIWAPEGQFEATVRDGADLYVRFVGEAA